MQVLEKLSKSNKVILMWIPGLEGIPGNEEADRLAKEGAVEVSPNQFAAIPFSVGKKPHQEAIGTEALGQVDYLYWVSAIQSAVEIPPA
jgi:hypothetical protein